MIQLYPQQLPQQTSGIVAQGSAPTRSFFFFLQALFNRTGGQSGIPFTIGANLSALDTTLANALALTNDYNEVLLAPGTGVRLANLQPGQMQWVYNGTGGGINVFPTASGQIDALAVGAAYVLANGKTQVFTCTKQLSTGAAFYRSLQLG